MIDNEPILSDPENGQEVPKPSPLRASNTSESLKPREVARIQAAIDFAEEQEEETELFYRGTMIPFDRPLETRVKRLEELIDGLLDRLAAYNVKSAHKI